MARYIDAEQAKTELKHWCMETAINNVGSVIGYPEDIYADVARNRIDIWIDNVPTADVQEVRHGEWQMKPLFNSQLDESDVAVRIRCSCCGMKLIAQKCGPFPNYCANCGAKNDTERGNDVQK